MGKRRRQARTCSLLALALLVEACFSWRFYEPTTPLSQAEGLPYRLRATLTDSTQVELTSPFVKADTLYGRSGARRDTMGVSVADVSGLERERLNIWRTLGVTVVAPVAVVVGVFAIVCGDNGCDSEPLD